MQVIVIKVVKEEPKQVQSSNIIEDIISAFVEQIVTNVPKEQPQAITIEQLYGMINDKKHELTTLHTSYGNTSDYMEQHALRRRIESAAKELNRLMTIAQCR